MRIWLAAVVLALIPALAQAQDTSPESRKVDPIVSIATMERGRDGIEALAWGTKSFSIFDDRFSVAGAGVGGRDVHRTIFNPRWRGGSTRGQD